ncbi:MAG: 2Fe-2S iron-sulfur cluster-binding protein [Bdellovibrionales bacterium]
MKITVIDEKGAARELEASPGMKVLEAMQDANLPVLAQCGGSCACATCHVYVDAAWVNKIPQPSEDESAMLDGAFDVTNESRLACQIELTDELDGLKVTMAPGSF